MNSLFCSISKGVFFVSVANISLQVRFSGSPTGLYQVQGRDGVLIFDTYTKGKQKNITCPLSKGVFCSISTHSICTTRISLWYM